MSDWIGLVFILVLLIGGLLSLTHLSKPYQVTKEEFEKRAGEAPGLLSAGVMGLQKFLDPAAGKAMEVQEDLKQGHYDIKQELGDGPEAGSSRERLSDQENQL